MTGRGATAWVAGVATPRRGVAPSIKRQQRQSGRGNPIAASWTDVAEGLFATLLQKGQDLFSVHSQNMTTAAWATAERKTFGHLS